MIAKTRTSVRLTEAPAEGIFFGLYTRTFIRVLEGIKKGRISMNTALEFLVFLLPFDLGIRAAKASHQRFMNLVSEKSIAAKIRAAVFMVLGFGIQLAIFIWATIFSGLSESFLELFNNSRPISSAELAMLLVVVYFVSWITNFVILSLYRFLSN